ncbi:hypothetical protein FW774_16185 [Pedobacter sp. BS3]|nr:hypothetical protein FW774_16185 [Pedobacter sp. BS3]
MGCKRDSDYIKNTVSPYISNFDIRKLYKGSDVTLTKETMREATYLKGVVISDHSGNNLPAGLLVVQNIRRVGNGIDSLRGMAINLGSDAAKYVPGDSVHIKIEGGVLKRVDGILQITGIPGANVTKVASGVTVKANRGFANQILAMPDRFECTLITIVKATYNPTLEPTDVMAGDKKLNDGTSDLNLHTEANATFANLVPPYSGNYTGIVFNIVNNGVSAPQHRIRTANDIVTLSSTVDIPEIVITGWVNDVEGTDANYEYMQFRATKDINFAVTPFSVVTTNNAGASTPTGFPTLGWATGDLRTYKLELTSGTVSKGEFFYVGGTNKFINGSSSTSIATSKWIKSFNYNSNDSPKFYTGGSTFGTKTGNLLANSGNTFGIAVFRGLDVTPDAFPIDVVFITGSVGSVYQAGPAPTYGVGYRIGNTDVYDRIDPITGNPQYYYRSGTNTFAFTYAPGAATNAGDFYILGGVFDTVLGKWTKARSQTLVDLSKTSTIAEIENEKSTEIK